MLGILALLHLHEVTLLAVSVLIYGGALLMASVTSARLRDLRMRLAPSDTENARAWAREMVYADTGSGMLIGATVVVLGILALSGLNALALALVSLLCIGASVLMNGVSLGGRIAEAMFRAS